MLTFNDKGLIVARIKGGPDDKSFVSYDENGEYEKICQYVRRKNKSGKTGKIQAFPTIKWGRKKGSKKDRSKPKKWCERILVCGPSGSGKTNWTKDYIGWFNKIFPDNNVWVFSRLEDDTKLDKLNIQRIIMDDNIKGLDIHQNEEILDGDCLVFDDIDTILDSDIKNNVLSIIQDALETGRHKNLYVVITRHMLYTDTRQNNMIYNEITRLVFFQKTCNRSQIATVLARQFGIKGIDRDQLLQVPGNWLCLSRNPSYYMTEYEIGIM
jgi:hypothetical protein